MASDSYNANLNAILKTKYVNKIRNVIPPTDKLAMLFPLRPGVAIGNRLQIPVQVSAEHGITLGGADSAAFTLETPVASVTQPASVATYAYAQKGILSQDIMDRAKGGDRSVEDAVKYKIRALTEQASFVREISCMHGMAGIGNILARTNDSNTVQTFSLTQRTWATGIWMHMLGGAVDIYNGASKVTSTTSPTVTSYSASARTITLTGTEADLDNVAAGYTIYPKGGYSTAMMEGLSYIVGSTASTIHNISQSSYPVWASDYVDAAAKEISLDLIEEAVVKLQDKGCAYDLYAIMAHSTAKRLKSDLQKQVRRSPGQTTVDFNTNTIGFNDNSLQFVPYLYAKPGEVLIVPQTDVIYRMGVDTDFVELGKGVYVQTSETTHGGFMKIAWNQAIVCESPGFTVKIQAIGSATA